jgi:hypothetical protein
VIGDLLTFTEAAQEMFLAGQEMGVGPEGVLVSFFGFPTMPKPVPAGPGGVNRLPPKIHIKWAGHPALWLDESQRLQRPGESEQAWLVRLYLELTVRGYMQEEDDGSITWTDALMVDDIDVESDLDASVRVKAWIDGGADPDLDTLRLDDGELAEMGGQPMLDWEARRMWLTYEKAWIRQAGANQLRMARVVSAAHGMFTPPGRWDAVFESWDSAWERWKDNPNDQQTRFGLVEESQVVESRLIVVQQHRAALASCALADGDFSGHTQHQLQQEAELARDQGHSQDLRGQVLRGNDQAAQELNEHLHQWMRREVQAGTQLQQMGVGPRWIEEQANQLEANAQSIERMLGEMGQPPGVTWESQGAP